VNYFDTSCRHADETVTKIRVGVTSAAWKQIEELVSDPKPMIERCIWRYIWTKHQVDAVKGESVEFKLDAEEIWRLFADLKRIDSEEMQRSAEKDQARS